MRPGTKSSSLGVLVVVATLDEAARAVADADDRDADLAVAAACAGPVRAVASFSPLLLRLLAHVASWSRLGRLTWTIRWMDGDGGADRDEGEGGGEDRRPPCRVVEPGRRAPDSTSATPPMSPARTRPTRQDDEPDLARHEADAAMPDARREAEALGLGPGVADHERRGHRGRREDRARREVGRGAARRRCRRRRRPRPARSKTESMNAPSLLTPGRSPGRARRRTCRRRRRRGRRGRRRASLLRGRDGAPTIAIPKPMSVRRVRASGRAGPCRARSGSRRRGRGRAAPG